MKNFAIIGVGGYVAPRHLKAIYETGNNLIAAYDTSDSVGVLDSYFPATSFFTEMELFDRHCTKAKNRGEQLDYVSICTPNYLHDAPPTICTMHTHAMRCVSAPTSSARNPSYSILGISTASNRSRSRRGTWSTTSCSYACTPPLWR